MIEVGYDDKFYPPAKIVPVVDLLAEIGFAPADVLQGVELQPDDLQRSGTRISVNQVLQIYRNAMRLAKDDRLAFRLGSRTHLSAYGLYGFAMLCSPDLRSAMHFAVKYHTLIARVCRIAFQERGRSAAWIIEPVMNAKVDSATYRFITEVQLAVHISLMRDMADPFVPTEITVKYPPAGSGLSAELTGCPVRFEQAENQLIFDASWLNASPGLGHRTTYPEMVALCDQHLADLELRTGIAGKVRRVLLQNLANHPSFEATAAQLQTPFRTLRRQLENQGTSFRTLLDELRSHLAAKYLRDTAMTNEDIAFALGFSDAANFRRAFSRWTGTSPTAFRRQGN